MLEMEDENQLAPVGPHADNDTEAAGTDLSGRAALAGFWLAQ